MEKPLSPPQLFQGLWSGEEERARRAPAPLTTCWQEERTCRGCGCTDQDCRQCLVRTDWPCYWVEADRCAACAGRPGRIRRRAAQAVLRWRLQARAPEGGR